MSGGKTYFVSGIDTDAGKSYATGWLAGVWRGEGRSVITQKLVQTGCPAGEVSEDIALHRRIMGLPLLSEDLDHTTCSLRFEYPASPDLASRLEGRAVDLALADEATGKLLQKYDTVLIEGAGGLMVPLDGLFTTLDYVSDRGLPLILVTNPRLGSVNHTLLSLEACRGRGVEVAMALYNLYPETSPEITADTRRIIAEYLARHHPGCVFTDVPYINLAGG